MSKFEMPAEKAEKPKAAPRGVLLEASVYLYDPYAQIRFAPGVPVEVEKVTSWQQCQIDAGLMAVVK